LSAILFSALAGAAAALAAIAVSDTIAHLREQLDRQGRALEARQLAELHRAETAVYRTELVEALGEGEVLILDLSAPLGDDEAAAFWLGCHVMHRRQRHHR
jgi:hypothetical protein